MRGRRGLVALPALALAILALGAVAAPPAEATRVRSIFPSDALTVADPEQRTGRRIALRLPDCAREPAGCDEVRLLNRLDGFSVSPRVAIAFSAPIRLETVTRRSAFVLPLFAEPLPSPIALGRLVWDPEGRVLYARPERALLQGRRYAVVVTARVLDRDGDPLALGREGRLAGAAGGLDAVALRRLEDLGVPRPDVVAMSVFTTRSVTAGLEQMRAVVEAGPAPELRFALGPAGARSVYRRADLEGLEHRRQVSTVPGQALADPVSIPLGLLPPSEVGTIAMGSFRAPSFLAPERYVPDAPTGNRAIGPAREEEVHVTVFLPRGDPPAAGWPVAIFGHGFGNDRHLPSALLAGTMARHGLATLGMNVVGHGGGPEGRLTVTRAGGEALSLPGGGRGLDLDGDGRIGSTEGVGTLNRGPLALVGSRDGMRQTVVDLMSLIRALRRGVDVDGDGRPDLDGERVYYVGQSFGGMYGTLLLAVDPLARVGALNVPGGPIVEIARLAPAFRPLVIEQLKRRQPALLNGERDFVESLPLPDEPPVRAPAPGALAIQAYLARAEWLGQAADPVAFAPYLRQAPLQGVGPKAVLYQMAAGDRTVPNVTTENILRAGALASFLSVYRHDRVAPALPERFGNPHAFLVWNFFPEVAAIGRAAQEQVARFFLSGGRRIERTDERFEVPGAPGRASAARAPR
jgi:hypothetical protein